MYRTIEQSKHATRHGARDTLGMLSGESGPELIRILKGCWPSPLRISIVRCVCFTPSRNSAARLGFRGRRCSARLNVSKDTLENG